MKCPKCLYIGFETGDRCKNCGYDFSLLAAAELTDADPPELQLRDTEAADQPAPAVDVPLSSGWASAPPAVDDFREAPEPVMTFAVTPPEMPLGFTAAPARPARPTDLAEPALPLFAPDSADDEPLIKLPAAPRAPLAVRRTPETPRLRPVTPGPTPRLHEDAVLQFTEEPENRGDPFDGGDAADVEEADAPFVPPVRQPAPRGFDTPGIAPSTIAARVVAALIDHGILFGIDAAVLYFTLRLTGLELSEWRVLPLLPLLAFLVSLKVAYLSAFTAAGGQTIGKMATHIRVVSDDGGGLAPARAFRRALLGLASIATFGAPFLPALTDPARRGVHDRAAGTRVIGLTTR
jgi:uncharacterized RDD family membrane protein YckC